MVEAYTKETNAFKSSIPDSKKHCTWDVDFVGRGQHRARSFLCDICYRLLAGVIR